jgi:probable rRNA maturation factor
MVFVKRSIAKAATYLPKNHLKQVSVAVIGATRMKQLHAQFMDIPTPTDVLTFELEHDAHGKVVSGEIVVCVDVARTIARRSDRKVEHELTLYVLHGLLHLCGMDDLEPKNFMQMHETEDRILTQIGIGRVFAA